MRPDTAVTAPTHCCCTFFDAFISSGQCHTPANARCLCVYSNTVFAEPSHSHSVHLSEDQPRKIVLQFIYEGTPIKYKLASIQISRVGLKSGRLVSWVQGYHKSRRKRDIYVRLLGLKRRCVFHNSCKTGKDFEAEADNWTMEKHSGAVLRRADVCTKDWNKLNHWLATIQDLLYFASPV